MTPRDPDPASASGARAVELPAVDDAVRRDLAPDGTLRAALNFGNPVLVQRDAPDGEPRGVTVDLARELARRLAVPLAFVPYETAGRVVDAAARNEWTVAFLAIDPLRAEQIAFTPPYVIIEGSYLVREDSPLRAIDEFDRPGVRIAVGKGAAYDLYLTRALRHAQLVRAPSSALAIELFLDDGLEAAAGVRQPLVAAAAERGGLRVIDGRFTAIEQAMGVPQGRAAGHAFLCAYIEAMKASGFVAEALARSGQRDAGVAPPAPRVTPPTQP